MININHRLQQLLSGFGENEVVEFKEAKNSYDFEKLGKYFSALSNEANLKGINIAWLVLGINNDHCVVGTQYRSNRHKLEALKKEIADHTNSRLSFIEIHICDHPNGRVLLFEIPAALQGLPTSWKGHYYGREFESIAPLSLEEIERIRKQNNIQDWSAGICHDATINDLCSDAIALARKEFSIKNPKLAHESNNWDIKAFLNKAKLAINDRITRTAILLLGKEDSAHFLNPSSPTITWILKDKDNIERDYEHFSCPLLINAEKTFRKIRNLKYRYMSMGRLFPEEVDQYDPFIIREALNNAIAHQDYELGGKITVIEFEDGRLCFSNNGHFIPGSVEKVIQSDAPETRYRNRFLTDAMVNLNMIDTIGSGIKKMFIIQRDRYFPLPEYQIDRDRVQVMITGRVLDVSYAQKIAELPSLSLQDIILLDRVQKRHSLSDEQIRYLKTQNLIEGRKPNFHISAKVATDQSDKAQYIKNRGFDDNHYKKMITDYIRQFGEAKRADIDQLVLDKLPDILDEEQKHHKIKNLIQSLKNQGVIEVKGKIWKMSK